MSSIYSFMKRKSVPYELLSISLLFIIVGVVMIPVSPALQPIPHRDSGVFLYIGKGILQGEVPYLDFWDHKGPVIYYLNALGLSLVDHSYWGVWIIEIVSLFLSSLLSYFMMKSLFGNKLALTGTAMWIVTLGYIFTEQFGAGNHVEEYAILFYIVQIYLFLKTKQNRPDWKFLIIGAVAGLSILLRPNLSSILASIFIILIGSMIKIRAQNRWNTLANLAILTIGTFLPLLFFTLYFWQKQAFAYFLSDVFLYNFYYLSGGASHLNAFTNSFRLLGGILFAGIFAWGMILFTTKVQREAIEANRSALLISIALPLEAIFSLISGHGFLHYYLSWLPLLGLAFCIFIQVLLSSLKTYGGRAENALLIAVFMIQAASFMFNIRVYLPTISKLIRSDTLFIVDERRSPEWDGMKKLYDIVPKGGNVIFWGNEVQYNFIMDLISPSKFTYIYPFLNTEYANGDMQQEFLEALQNNKPVIVDVQPSSTPPIQSLRKWRDYPKTMPFIRYINEHYVKTQEISVINYYYAGGQEWQLAQKWVIWVPK